MKKSLSVELFRIIIWGCFIFLSGCDEYGLKPRTNPYDPEVEWGAEIDSIIALTNDGRSFDGGCSRNGNSSGRYRISQGSSSRKST